MSSQETLTAEIDRFFDAMEAGDVVKVREIFAAIVHPECVFDSAVGSIIEGRTFNGPEEIFQWMAELREGFELRYTNRAYEFVDPNTLVATYDFSLESRSTGLPLEYPASLFCRFEDGRIIKTKSFRTHEAAREEALADA